MKKRRLIILLLLMVIIAVGIWVFKKPKHTGPSPDEVVKELLEFDKNGDGQLSKDEVSERMQGLFVRGDANQDFVLTKEELRKLAEAQINSAKQQEREDDHR